MNSNNKKSAVQSHKIAALCYLLAEALQEAGANGEMALEIKNECETLGVKCENVLEDLFQVKEVYGSTYLIELSNKVDTVIRKNHQQITKTD
jgi:hypothetical protein